MYKIKFARLQMKLTQEELAERINVPSSVISYIETGAVNRICDELNIEFWKAFEEVEINGDVSKDD